MKERINGWSHERKNKSNAKRMNGKKNKLKKKWMNEKQIKKLRMDYRSLYLK